MNNVDLNSVLVHSRRLRASMQTHKSELVADSSNSNVEEDRTRCEQPCDLDLPIALKKEVKTCTKTPIPKNPISDYVAYSKPSKNFKHVLMRYKFLKIIMRLNETLIGKKLL